MARHGSLADQLGALRDAPTPRKAANDNKPKPPRYRGTLPALKWLWDNRPDLAPAFASALPRPSANWFVDVEPTRQEIRPTVGELLASGKSDDGAALTTVFTVHGKDCHAALGRLKFRNGLLTEWGTTKKGRKLRPTDRARSTEDKSVKVRSPNLYLSTKPTTPSPMSAEHYHRPMSGEPAIASMYDPLPGVEAARRVLQQCGVDGSVPAHQLPFAVTLLPLAVADGAGFLGGVSSPSGNSSEGAVMWEAPEDRKTDAATIIDEVAARGTLGSIGLRLGYGSGDALAAGKAALIEVAEVISLVENRKKRQFS